MNDHNNPMQDAMAEATRLTRAGRLAEATALIQRTLGGIIHDDVPNAKDSSAKEPIEATHRIVEEKPSATDTSTQGTVPRNGASAGPARSHPATAPVIHLPGARRSPGSMHSATERSHAVKSEVPPSSTQIGGQFIDRAFTNAVGTRAYKLYIPSAYTGQALPLVIMLHGCTQSSVDFAAGTRMNVLAERGLFFVAYPEQIQSANSLKCWNWFQPDNQHRDAGEPSLIAGITREIMSGYHIDADRVYIVGMSAGGAMATIMAATYPDLYAAVATVAMVNADHMLDQWLQGIENGGGSARSATVERGHVTGGHAYTRFIYHNAGGQAIVEKWIVHHAGHAWSGGSSSGSFTEPKGPDASAEMVRFFSVHSRR